MSQIDNAEGLDKFTVEIDSVDERLWTDYLNCYKDASIYQTIAFGSYQKGGKTLSYLVLKRKGLPVSICLVRILTVPILNRGIAYVFWGPLCVKKNEKKPDKDTLQRALDALYQEYVINRKLMLKISSGLIESSKDEFGRIFREAGFKKNADCRIQHTVIIDLFQSFDELWGNLSFQWKRNLRYAERNKLEIIMGTENHLLLKFHTLYEQLLKIKAIPEPTDVEKYLRIQNELPEEHKMLVFICSYEEQPVAGVVVSFMGNTGICLLAASNQQGRKLYASAMLFWKSLLWLKEKGCKWYDLGGVDPIENPGGYHFKSGLGGKQIAFLGQYESCRNEFSRFIVKTGEILQKLKPQSL